MITNYQEFLLENNTRVKPDDFGITKYEWSQGKLNCFENIDISNQKITKIPFSFGKIEGNFSCYNNSLTSLYGCPHTVTGYFSCSHNRLTSLIGGPQIVGDLFECHDNKLISLEYCPKYINGDFNCRKNMLTNFEYCPLIVGGYFTCYDNQINSIEDCPLSIIYGGISETYHFREVYKIVKNNVELFEPLLNDKIGFHQMVMRIDPTLIQYYNIIQPPKKKTILFK